MPRLRIPRSTLVKCFGLGVCLLAAVGCSSDVVQKGKDAKSDNLYKISAAYLKATQKLNKPPQSLEDLKPILQKEFGDAEAALKSPNDGLPYVIVYGVDMRTSEEAVVIAYEQRGSDGKRYVLDAAGGVSALGAADFAKAKFPRGHKPK